MVIGISLVVICVVIGILNFFEKGKFLLAGYNSMSKEDKAKMDEKKLFRWVGCLMLVLAALFAVIFFTANVWVLRIGGAAVILLCLGFAVFSSSNYFKK